MVNLFALAATAGDLSKTCADIIRYISQSAKVDNVLEPLRNEIDGLANVFYSIHENIPKVESYAITSRTDREHWVHVSRAMEDCGETLKILDEIIGEVNNTKGNFLPKGFKQQVKLDIKSGDIMLLQCQVSSCRRAMDLSLLMIR
jgi:hypothetical protein